jgi:hypothetical protein
MKDQHEKDATNLMKSAKALELQCEALIIRMEQNENTNKRGVALAKTNIQQGFMWALRSIEQPTRS